MTTLLSDYFVTKLGTIRIWIESDIVNTIDEQGVFSVITKGHIVTLQRFEVSNDWLPDTMSIESSCGWRWHIEKLTTDKERLTIYCKLLNPTADISWDYNSGEHLDAIQIESKTYQLHIGTEDGEMLQARAEISDWMPNRLKDEVGFDNSFTQYVDFGFKTTVPDLEQDEKAYFHFLVATKPIKQSAEYPEERDAATWFAVDQFKRFLDEQVGSNVS